MSTGTGENTPTNTTDEAFDKMANTKGWYIAMARYIAAQIILGRDPWYTLGRTGPRGAEIIRVKGTVNSYAVRMAMTRAGMLIGYKGKLHFLGVAFGKGSTFLESTGEMISYEHSGDDEEAGRAVHQRTIKVWKERKGGGIGAVPEPKMPPDVAERVAAALKAEADTAKARENALDGRR